MCITNPIGFIGLGRMGEPMAANLLRAGTPLVVWNRTRTAVDSLEALGASAATDVADLWTRCTTVLFMLADARALEDVLGWNGTSFAHPIAGHTLVNLGTIAPEQSEEFEDRVTRAGGRYIEAPVSGSRIPAERAELVLMLAGEQPHDVQVLLGPIYAAAYQCGPVPQALATKLAVNAFLITMVTGLAEAVRIAESRGLDLDILRQVLDAGPMASEVSRIKLAKMAHGDYETQAAVDDVAYNSRLVLKMATESGASAPLMHLCEALYSEASGLGCGGSDMAAVLEALRTRDSHRH